MVRITADPGRDVPRSHDRAGRRRRAAEDAERDRAQHPARGLTIIFLLAVVTLQPFAIYSGAPQSVFVLVALLVCLIPTTIGGLLSAIGIAGMDRLIQHNVLAMSGRAVEAAGDVDTLLLDKTGTITLGNRQATEFIPLPGVDRGRARRRRAARVAGRRDAGRPLDRRARQGEVRPARPRAGAARGDVRPVHRADAHVRRRPATAAQIRKGAADAIAAATCSAQRRHGRRRSSTAIVERIARAGGTPLVVADGRRALGVDPPEGHRQGRHARALRAAARDGHQDRDDHRRQPADRRGDRRRSRRRRLPRRGDARRQDGADQARAGATASWSR